MKMIYVTFNVSVREPLLKLLKESNVNDYQVIEQATAKSVKGEPRFNTPVWPGYNSSIIMQFSNDEKAIEMMQKIKEFNKNAFNDNELITACSWTLDDYFYE
ncbi:PG0541 family transporter-associated protein [Bacteroidota bacterium]